MKQSGTNKDALTSLAERCEAATGLDRLLDAEIYVAIDGERENLDALAFNGEVGSWVPSYTASLDAAMTLVPEGWGYSICPLSTLLTRRVEGGDESIMGRGATPALALCAAALRTQASKGDE